MEGTSDWWWQARTMIKTALPRSKKRAIRNGDETQEQKTEICSIATEQGLHPTKEVTALPPSFDY
jgi:hypothetical protein